MIVYSVLVSYDMTYINENTWNGDSSNVSSWLVVSQPPRALSPIGLCGLIWMFTLFLSYAQALYLIKFLIINLLI